MAFPVKMFLNKTATEEDIIPPILDMDIKVEQQEQGDPTQKNMMMMKLELQEGKDSHAPSFFVGENCGSAVARTTRKTVSDKNLKGKSKGKKQSSKKTNGNKQALLEPTQTNTHEDVWFEELAALQDNTVAKTTFKSTRKAFPVIHWKKEKNGGKKEGPIQKLIQNAIKSKEVKDASEKKKAPMKRKKKREKEEGTDKKDKKPKVDHKCLVCEKQFPKMELLNVHMRIHVGLKPYVCSVCQKGFMRNRELIKHTRLHTGEKLSKCSECDKVFTSKSALDRHFRGHTGEKPFTCYICGKSYKENSGLQGHMRLHTGEKPFMCSLCGKSFYQRAHLYIHMKFHSSEKPHSCSVCGKAYRMKSEVKVHMRVHTGERPHKCTECDKAFRDTGTLRKHQKIHTGEKPWKCTTCGDTFRESGALYKHMRGHTGEKPYQCSECGKAFREKEVLTRHMRIHSGEKPCCCTVCFKAFRESGALYRHMRTHAKKGEKPGGVNTKRINNTINPQSTNNDNNNSDIKVPTVQPVSLPPRPITPPLLPVNVNPGGNIPNSYPPVSSFLPMAFAGNAPASDFLTNTAINIPASIPSLSLSNTMQSGFLN